ncbi:LicD family protein [Porphyromonas sp.]|uniref:LicD family protein n=1 Tax=Porphyromonas sp. TaxID=1924944 RepID=UPI0026DCFE3A|nr:LicD family protein [Porphyromonas sp.]MDO4695366.1 LicD family protein [Porphyromonas sp.]MDO4770367.1 LicD family protein [Porphyromonas sp.]
MKIPHSLRRYFSFYYEAKSGPLVWLKTTLSEYGRRKSIKRQNLNLKRYHHEILKAFTDALKELGLPYWLDYGTLLGVIRDNSYVENDSDLDFGMYLHDYTPQITETLKRYGFKKEFDRLVDDGRTGRESVYSYKGVHTDIFFYAVQGEHMSTFIAFPEKDMDYEAMVKKYGGMRVYRTTHPYMKTKHHHYKDLNVSIPEDEHTYLISCYGEGYNIKDPHYDYVTFKAPNRQVLDDKFSVLVYDK